MTLEDQNPTYSVKIISNSQSLEQYQERATKDTELSSKQQDQELSGSDSFSLFKNDIFA
jgi:hypothetical protein